MKKLSILFTALTLTTPLSAEPLVHQNTPLLNPSKNMCLVPQFDLESLLPTQRAAPRNQQGNACEMPLENFEPPPPTEDLSYKLTS